MLVYYLVAGLTANVALITNIIILLGVMCSIGTTFTLPGIAGVVLTVGMAVDANVLIYERIREELAKGKSLRGAIAAGYARAFGTIFDSHVTTLISSVILIFMGTGEIKGFGVTLTIGVAASLFTALVVTRLIFNFLLDRNWLKSLPMLHIIRSAKLNFMKVATPLFVITWAFIILSLGYGAFGRGEKLFGVDFLGGDSTTFSFAQKVGRGANPFRPDRHRREGRANPVSKGRQRRHGNVARDDFQRFGSRRWNRRWPNSSRRRISRSSAASRSAPSWARKSGSRPSSPACCPCSAFWSMSRSATNFPSPSAPSSGVLHDVLLTIGCYCIANAVSGRQFNATVVAAVLTIIGFSINDKIVIFDRIREDLKLGVRGTFQEVINQALNQTLSRTIITSGTVFLATLSLLRLRRRRHQRLRVHVPRRHHHRHLFEHLHRQRAGAVVAQGRAPEHRRVAGDHAAGRGAGKSLKPFAVCDLRLTNPFAVGA